MALPAIMVSACQRPKPEGQIIATVNGDDVTTHDLDQAESQLSPSVKLDKASRGRLVAGLVDMRLAVQEARREGLNKTPEYLDASRAANDAILVELLRRNTAQRMQPPNPGEIDRYLADHAQRFAGRTIYKLDQVRFPESKASLAAVRSVTTLEGAEAALRAAGVQSQRAIVTLDSLPLSDPAAQRLAALPPAKLLGDISNGIVSLSLVVGRTPAPLAGADARKAAQAMIQGDALKEALGNQAKRLRESAKVAYQAGYAPPSAPSR